MIGTVKVPGDFFKLNAIKLGPWWWSNGQIARPLLLPSEFESR